MGKGGESEQLSPPDFFPRETSFLQCIAPSPRSVSAAALPRGHLTPSQGGHRALGQAFSRESLSEPGFCSSLPSSVLGLCDLMLYVTWLGLFPLCEMGILLPLFHVVEDSVA